MILTLDTNKRAKLRRPYHIEIKNGDQTNGPMATSTSRSHRGKPRSISDNFRKLFNLFGSKDRILVTIDADPDSMASAMALKRILWRRVHTLTIAHFNEIRRFDNLTMIRLLKIPLEKLNKIDQQNFSKILLIDGLRKNAGSLASKAYGALGNAGGHRAMARAEISLANLEGHIKEYDNATLSPFVIRQFENSVRYGCVKHQKDLN